MAIQKQTLFVNARIVGRPAGLYAVLVNNGRIESITLGEGQSTEVAPGAEVIDCGRSDGSSLWISPVSLKRELKIELRVVLTQQGMIDWHTHQKLNAVAQHRLHLEKAETAQQALDMVSEALLNPKYSSDPSSNFVGVNMRNGTWPDPEKMCRESLDAISKDRPVFLIFNGYHSMCVNTAGLARCELRVDDYDSGVLLEKEAFDVSNILSKLGEDVLDQWIFEEADHAA